MGGPTDKLCVHHHLKLVSDGKMLGISSTRDEKDNFMQDEI